MTLARKSDLRRKTPLTAKTGLRRTAFNRSPKSASAVHARQRENQPSKRTTASPVPAKVRAVVAKRSGGWCEIATKDCTGLASEFAHRKKNGVGGRHGAAAVAHHVASNALHGCHNCHQVRCHREPAQAYDAGWMLREHQDPIAEPVLYRGVWRLLDDHGATFPIEPEEASR
jgi:5-methylcytosine-specific restriction enzyme A